jgi:tetratricopeptide (TPR) repeat protein
MEDHRLDVMRVVLDVLRGRSQAAIDRTLSALDRHAGEQEFEGFAADALLFLGEPEAARATLEGRSRLTPALGGIFFLSRRTYRTNYAFLLHQLGDRDRAAALFDESLRASHAAIERGSEWSSRPLEIAAIHAVRGNTDEALEWLERTYQAGYRLYRILAQDPMFVSIRGHEQFQAILARMEGDVARERERVEAEGIAAVVDSMIAAGREPFR